MHCSSCTQMSSIYAKAVPLNTYQGRTSYTHTLFSRHTLMAKAVPLNTYQGRNQIHWGAIFRQFVRLLPRLHSIKIYTNIYE